jgi:VWFA-related protein
MLKNLPWSFRLFSGLLLAASATMAAQQNPGTSTESQSPSNTETPRPASSQSDSSSNSSIQSFTVQSTDSQSREPAFTLQSTTRRVVVDVVVTGPDGKPVTGLTQTDFIVAEDGKPQSVHGFETHTPEQDRSLLPSAPSGLPSHTFVNLEQTPPSGPPVVVLLDFMNTPLDAQMTAHEQIMRFLERKPPSLEVAIFSLGDSLSMVQGFTTDTSRLVAAMKSKAAGPHLISANEEILRAQTTLDAFLDIGRLLTTIQGRKNLLWFSGSFDMLVLPKAQDVEQGALFVESSAGSPSAGPGSVVNSANLLPSATTGGGAEASASGFSNQIGSMTVLQDKLRKVAMVLAVSQTAVYPVDVRGLMVDTGFSVTVPAASQLNADPRGHQGTPGIPSTPGGVPASVQNHNDFMQSLNAAHATMDEIAAATGGHAFENSNGIAAAAALAVSDGESYYSLNYAPSNRNFDGGLRTIHVSLDKPLSNAGYKLAYRSAYYAVDPAAVEPDASSSNTLNAALLHGAPQAQRLVFKAQIDPDGAPVSATENSPLAVKLPANVSRKTKKDPEFLSGMVQSYKIRLAILAQQLQFTQSEDGRRHAALEIGVYAYAADGRKIGGAMQKLQAAMPPLVYIHALENGMYHNLQVQLPVEAASLRLAIYDPDNHRTGSLETSLPLLPTEQAESHPSATP